MFIEQINEFQLGGGWAPWPCVYSCNWLNSWQNKENFRVDYYLLLQNIEGGNVPHFTLPGPNHLQILHQNIRF